MPDNNQAVSKDGENSAWAEIHVPQDPQQMIEFCQQDVERLFRINPYLEFENWQAMGQNGFRFCGKNSSQSSPFLFDLSMDTEAVSDGLLIRYRSGIKEQTRFSVEESPHGAKLTIREIYRPVTEDDEISLAQVDRSLNTWAGDIQKYLLSWKQWSWLAPWRWYMRRFWQTMKPSGRRIAYMFWWITVVEIALIVLGVGIYFFEYR